MGNEKRGKRGMEREKDSEGCGGRKIERVCVRGGEK